MTTNALFICTIIIFALCTILMYLQNFREGFDNPSTPPTTAPLPSTSAQPPADVPGSSTNNPTQSIAQPKDIQATIDSVTNMQNSKQLADTSTQNITKLSSAMQSAIANAASPDTTLQALNNALTTSSYTVSQLSDMRQSFDAANAAYASLPRKIQPRDLSGISVGSVMTNLPVPTTVAAPSGKITLTELTNLRDRVQGEIVRVQNLRSSSATLQAKQSQLEQLLADLNQILDSIQRGQRTIQDVPIQESDANAFLQSLPKDVISTSLLPPQGTAQLHPTVTFSDSMNAYGPFQGMLQGTAQGTQQGTAQGTTQDASQENMYNVSNLQSLLENAKYLKWGAQVNLEFNPELAQNDRYLKRLEDMEKRLTKLVMSETPISPSVYQIYTDELKTIRAMLLKKSNQDPNPDFQPPKSMPLSTPDTPTSLQLDMAQGSTGNFPNPPVAKPGTYRNDYPDIRTRASAAAFDPSQVGGLDYKQRVQSLCSQIGAANIGKPEQFGCIADQSSVSKVYSWKGNYEMVCSRLGNLWGGWYPEMFGCPKQFKS